MRTYTPTVEKTRLDMASKAVRDGANTTEKLARAWGISPAHACQFLLEGFQHGRLERTKVGQHFEYRIAL